MFSGIGGIELGLMKSGLVTDVAWQIDTDEFCTQIIESRFPNSLVLNKKVEKKKIQYIGRDFSSIRQNLIEFAKSYSFSEYRIATKYALKPASIPTVTIIGLDFAFMLGNAFLVETVFVWPGMAKYGVEVILAKDLNGIIATALVITTFFLIINMIVDFVVLLLNPRITTKD